MVIGIDGNEANVTKRVGIGEYAFQLLVQLENLTAHISDLTFTIYLKENPLEHMPTSTTQWRYRVLRPQKLWTQWRLPLDLYTHLPRPDVFFSPSHYAPRFSPIPTVVSVMDLSYLYFPELFNKKDLYQLTNWTAYSVKNARKVLTISDSSRNDIIKEYRVSPKKVVTIYPGIKETVSLDTHVYGMNHLQSKYHLSNNFVLFVGTLQPRKNIVRLIEAFAKVILERSDRISSSKRDPIELKPSRMTDLQLVIVGKRGWLYEEILAKPKELGIEDRVKFLEGVTDEELKLFYKHAQCYILPSLYEGFGLPVLEAMKYDCPVITSNVSSLPEAGGDAALYVDPKNVTDIAEKIETLLGNEKLRKELIEKGRKQVAKFSWEKAAKETVSVLEDLAKK